MIGDRFRCYCVVCKKYVPKGGSKDWFIVYASEIYSHKTYSFTVRCHGKQADLKVPLAEVDKLPNVCIAFKEDVSKEELEKIIKEIGEAGWDLS